jgi:hypothetical protein
MVELAKRAIDLRFWYGICLTAVEVLDGFSSEWGASSGDIIANASGTALFVSQELLWKEQRITPKFSFHTTYAQYRPNVLGSSPEQMLGLQWTNLLAFS